MDRDTISEIMSVEIIKPAISIVLATKGNKLTLLERCVKSLQKQTFHEYEIILVYSIYSEELDELLQKYGILGLKETGSTLGSARNLGVRNSQAEIVAFIDDDAEAPEDWLNKIYSIFQEFPSLCCLGGPNLTPPEESAKKPLSFVAGSFMESRMGQKISLNHSAVGKIAGCNVAYRKSIFEKIGYLNEKLRSGEDWDFHIRLTEKGYNIRFDPQISVWHHRQGLKHAFWNSSRMVPFFFSWKTLKYSKYESFFASFYFTQITFLFLLIILFVSPFVFVLFFVSLILGQFIFAAARTKTFGKNTFYYPLQLLFTITQILGFYFGLFKIIISKLSFKS